MHTRLTPSMLMTLKAVHRGEVYMHTVHRAFGLSKEYSGAHGTPVNLLRQAGLIRPDAGSDHLVTKFELTPAGSSALEQA